MRSFLRRAAGVSVTGYQLKSLFLCYGPPDTGKSTFLNALRECLGDYGAATRTDAFLRKRFEGTNTPELAKLPGKRIVTAVETNPGRSFDPTTVKSWTGGDLIQATAKYGHPFEFEPRGSVWISSNDRPSIDHDDEGMWRRLLLAPFEDPIPRDQQDEPRAAALWRDPANRAAVLAWAVRGWLEVQANGTGLDPPEAAREGLEAWREAEDPISAFLRARTRRRRGAWVTTDDLYHSYLFWARDEWNDPSRWARTPSPRASRGEGSGAIASGSTRSRGVSGRTSS